MHRVIAGWHEVTASRLPSEVWDAHTHTGDRDPDGYTNTSAELTAALDEAGHAGAVVCSSLDRGGYAAPNDRILAEAAASGGRLIPFLRVDPNQEGALGEVERSLAAGHRGIKLHPRGESFRMSHPALRPLAALAVDHGAPFLIHAGRGMPALGPDLLDLLETVPGLRVVLAHCAISDLAVLARRAHPGVYYDTAWWNPADLAALFSWVDAGRILYASDTPYGNPVISGMRTARAALQAGVDDTVVAGVFGGNLMRLLDGSEAQELGVGTAPMFDVRMQRVQSYVLGALAAIFSGGSPTEAAALALRASDGSWPEGSVVPAVRRTLEAALAASGPGEQRLRFRLLLVAASAMATPDVAAPSL
jgi:predicted TIM-barrel fold metal-dependent hydrolase